ncbi:hypothetical protein N431DRAFT_483353 [Stipitochalara longipes BDJ]|nr:hypothetical protein N431DRAFT_483353 [Stipitochalara longipes BDJ]
MGSGYPLKPIGFQQRAWHLGNHFCTPADSSRPLTLQCLLPSRTLHFHAEELIWECKSAVQCECEELDRRYSFEENLVEGWLKNFVTGSLYADKSAEKLGYVWLDLVSEFGALDRLPALSGLACEFSNKSLGTYVGGIWEHDLARGLLFETVIRKEPLAVNHSRLSAPSWSWASAYLAGSRKISYGIVLRDGFLRDPRFYVMSVYLTPHRSNPFSWVEHSLLQVKGCCAVAGIVVEPSSLGQNQNRNFIMEIGGVQRIIPLKCFLNDEDIQDLTRTPLCCLLVGRQDDPEVDNIDYNPCEYVLVLRKASAELNTYKRAGLLLTKDDSYSLRNEPVLTLLLA